MRCTPKRPSSNSRIRVVVRVRPPIAEDVDNCEAEQYDECVEEDPSRGTLQLKKPFFDTREFSLDIVLSREATQAQTYEAVGRPVVDDVLEGFNGTVLAYGQTGTGKTYTIYGPLSYWQRSPVGYGVGGGLGRIAPPQAAPQLALQPQFELSGVVTRAAMQIFAYREELMRRGDGTNFRVLVSSLQIWQEAISDLLGDRRSSGPLTVREDPERGVYAEALTEHEVSGADGVLALVHESATNRATCSTSMNRSSSRSHAILLIRVEQWTPPPEEDGHVNDDRASIASSVMPRVAVRRGLLSIVDLAGSERCSPAHRTACSSNRLLIEPPAHRTPMLGTPPRPLHLLQSAAFHCLPQRVQVGLRRRAFGGGEANQQVDFCPGQLHRGTCERRRQWPAGSARPLSRLQAHALADSLTRRQHQDDALRLCRAGAQQLRRDLLHAAARDACYGSQDACAHQ